LLKKFTINRNPTVNGFFAERAGVIDFDSKSDEAINKVSGVLKSVDNFEYKNTYINPEYIAAAMNHKMDDIEGAANAKYEYFKLVQEIQGKSITGAANYIDSKKETILDKSVEKAMQAGLKFLFSQVFKATPAAGLVATQISAGFDIYSALLKVTAADIPLNFEQFFLYDGDSYQSKEAALDALVNNNGGLRDKDDEAYPYYYITDSSVPSYFKKGSKDLYKIYDFYSRLASVSLLLNEQAVENARVDFVRTFEKAYKEINSIAINDPMSFYSIRVGNKFASSAGVHYVDYSANANIETSVLNGDLYKDLTYVLKDKDSGKILDSGKCGASTCESRDVSSKLSYGRTNLDLTVDAYVKLNYNGENSGVFNGSVARISKRIIVFKRKQLTQFKSVSSLITNPQRSGAGTTIKATVTPKFVTVTKSSSLQKSKPIGVLDTLLASIKGKELSIFGNAIAADIATSSMTVLPKAGYQTVVTCPIAVRGGNLTFTIGKDGVMNLDDSLLTNPQLANCTARTEGVVQDDDEDEVLTSTYALDLRTPLMSLINNLPTGTEPDFYINSVNGTVVNNLKAARTVNLNDKVTLNYVLPNGIAMKSYDMRGEGCYSVNAAVNFSCTDNPSICSYDHVFNKVGNFTPKFKATYQGKLITVTAPTITVVDPATVIPVATLSVPSTAQVGVPVQIEASITGTPSIAKWDVQQAAGKYKIADPKSNTTTITFDTAGTYRVVFIICKNGSCNMQANAFVNVGTVKPVDTIAQKTTLNGRSYNLPKGYATSDISSMAQSALTQIESKIYAVSGNSTQAAVEMQKIMDGFLFVHLMAPQNTQQAYDSLIGYYFGSNLTSVSQLPTVLANLQANCNSGQCVPSPNNNNNNESGDKPTSYFPLNLDFDDYYAYEHYRSEEVSPGASDPWGNHTIVTDTPALTVVARPINSNSVVLVSQEVALAGNANTGTYFIRLDNLQNGIVAVNGYNNPVFPLAYQTAIPLEIFQYPADQISTEFVGTNGQSIEFKKYITSMGTDGLARFEGNSWSQPYGFKDAVRLVWAPADPSVAAGAGIGWHKQEMVFAKGVGLVKVVRYSSRNGVGVMDHYYLTKARVKGVTYDCKVNSQH
jgi:hypothetical protein